MTMTTSASTNIELSFTGLDEDVFLSNVNAVHGKRQVELRRYVLDRSEHGGQDGGVQVLLVVLRHAEHRHLWVKHTHDVTPNTVTCG